MGAPSLQGEEQKVVKRDGGEERGQPDARKRVKEKGGKRLSEHQVGALTSAGTESAQARKMRTPSREQLVTYSSPASGKH